MTPHHTTSFFGSNTCSPTSRAVSSALVRLKERVSSKNARAILPHQLEEALQRAIRDQALTDREVDPRDHLLVNINSIWLRHSYHSTRILVREWMENTPCVQELLQQIAKMLNSNKQFRMDDSFSLNVSNIRDPGRGSGNKRVRKARMALQKLLDTKKSVIAIKNNNEFCCARAIVTMKALADAQGNTRNRDYCNLKEGYPIQGREARKLHRDSGVLEGPCGIQELRQFQQHLSNYRRIVLSVDHMYQLIFKGPPADKEIVLIKVGEHYLGCDSLPGFLGRNFFCVECKRGYEHNTMSEHPCRGKKCLACCQTHCQDYPQHGSEPAKPACPQCHRKFFGEDCMGNHYAYSETNGVRANYDKKIKNVCSTVHNCPQCNRLPREQEIETKR